MNAMVSNHPFRNPRSAAGRPAISLSVAKITWMWKSLMSVKRTRMRPSPLFSRSKALPISVMTPSMSPRLSAAICPGIAPMGAISMPLGPHPCRREVSLTNQYVSEPAVDTLTFLPLSSAAVFGPSGRTTMASNSGGPAMPATPLIGAPLTMNAMAGPEPSRTSIESAAAACCMRASPANAIDSISSPLAAKMPLRIPTSSGTNEKASGTALPTRSFSAAVSGEASKNPPAASTSISAAARIARRNETFVGMIALPALGEFPVQQPLGIAAEYPAPVGLRDVEPLDHLDRRRDRAERRVGGEHHVLAAEEFEPAAHRMGAAAEQRGVAVEVVQIVEVRPLERRQHLRVVLVEGAAAEHLQPRPDAAVVERDHPAEMMGDDLQLRIAVQEPVEYHWHGGH